MEFSSMALPWTTGPVVKAVARKRPHHKNVSTCIEHIFKVLRFQKRNIHPESDHLTSSLVGDEQTVK